MADFALVNSPVTQERVSLLTVSLVVSKHVLLMARQDRPHSSVDVTRVI